MSKAPSKTSQPMSRVELEKLRVKAREQGAQTVDGQRLDWLCTMALDWPPPEGALSASVALPQEPTFAMLKALAGDPLLLAASDAGELRSRYQSMLACVQSAIGERS